MPDDSMSLHSMANGGHDEGSDEKSESSVLPVGEDVLSYFPDKAKSRASPSVNEDVSTEKQASEVGKADPDEGARASIGDPPEAEATKADLPVERPSGTSTQEEGEALPPADKIEEAESQRTPGTHEDSETQLTSRPEQPSISGEKQLKESGSAHTKDSLREGSTKDSLRQGSTTPAQENSALLTSLPPVKKSLLRRLTTRRVNVDEVKEQVVIPSYLSKGMVDAIESAGVACDDAPQIESVRVPRSPILIFINSKSGGRLGPGLEALLVEFLAPTQVYDLSKCKPAEVLRHGLGYLEKQADAGNVAALETRNNLRIMVAGGDGTVGWVLGTIAGLGQKERFKVPPVGVIPLGTGNDLARSFRWGGSTTSVSQKAVKRWLVKCTEADIATLDSWMLVVKPAPTCQDAPLTLPHAMQPHQHIPLEGTGSSKEDEKIAPYFEGSFWNYFSIGMDAQVAYGFHHLRDEAPWLASGRVSNQMVYGGYGCVQGWFCTPCAVSPVLRGLRQIVKVYIKKSADIDAPWEQMVLPPGIRAMVILNLQSYAGGRNPWGRPSSNRREKEGFVEAAYNDGVLEIVGFRDGWHTAFVLLDWLTAVRLGQARAVKLELTGKAHRKKAYMQMDGEPWQQPLGDEDEPPAVIEITRNPVRSICLIRK